MTLNKMTDDFGDSYYITNMNATDKAPFLTKRERGFEKVSFGQFKKDILKYPNGMSIGEDIDFLYNELKIPKRATAGSAGYDFFAPHDIDLTPGEEMLIVTGIKAYMLQDEKLEISPRSGLGFKYYLRLANTVGKIDSDYHNNPDTEGNIYIKIRNEGSQSMFVEHRKPFAQGSLEKYLLVDGDSFDGNARTGGIGSTG